MKKIMVCLCALMLLFLTASSPIGEDDWLVLDEMEYTPDSRYQARVLMRKMTLEDKIMQMFFAAPEALTGEKYTTSLKNGREKMRQYPVGGIILYGQNIVSEGQLRELTDAFQTGAKEAGKTPLFLAVDEEGGSVSRVANKLGYVFLPSPGEITEEDAALSSGAAIGAYLRELGINLDFAPVADVMVSKDAEIGLRSFGSDAEKVSSLAYRMAQGLRQQGVIPCYKHFPGIGSTLRDTHDGKAVCLRTIDEIRSAELLPFRKGSEEGIEMMMVSHITLRDVDREHPAALSSAVINGLLRREMGYAGVVVTDALRMRAVTMEFTQKQAVILSIQAGADMLLLPEDLDAAVRYVKSAVADGDITEERINESVERILALKIAAGLIQ